MKVRYRARALEDVDAIYQWVARLNTNMAEKVEAALFAAADWLGEHPEFGAITDEADIQPVVVLFRPLDDRVDAIHLCHF